MRKIADGLFVVPSTIRMPFVQLDLKMVVVRLKDNDLALLSPIRIEESHKKEIQSLGNVTTIIAPNKFHHLYVNRAKREFPGAMVATTLGLTKKRPDLKIDYEISNNIPHANWEGILDQTVLGGMPSVNETVFFHRASKTLIVTDLIFNIQDSSNLVEKFFWICNGAYQKPGPSRLTRFFIRNKTLARQSLEHILCWDFDRIIMAHGNIIENNGKGVFRDSFAWLLKN